MQISGFILAAGEGRRLRPATIVRPKALVPFCGVSLLELAASQLNTLDLEGIALNVHYQGDRVLEAAMRLARRKGWDLRVSQETKLLDTGGGLRQGIERLPRADHLLIHNVDVVLDYDLKKLVRQHLDTGALATLLMVPNRGPCTVALDKHDRIADFRCPGGSGDVTFTGVHMIRRDVLDFLPDQPACSIIRAYEAAQAAGKAIRAVVVEDDAYWADLGTADQYIRAHGEIADCALRFHPAMQRAQTEQARRRAALELKGVRCTGALGLGIGLGVPAGSQLHNAVLWDYTRLPQPALYADGIFVGEDVPPAKPVDEKRTPDARIYLSMDLPKRDTTLTPLLKQGSGRRYCRLTHGERSWVWCAYDPERRENAGYAAIADFLHRLGIRVPEVILHLPDTCELLARDLGQHVLVQNETRDLTESLRQVVEQIARLHVLGDQAARLEELPLQRGFTKGLYDWERDYFREHILGRLLGRGDLWGLAAREYVSLRDTLLRQPLVPIHRDLQSANVMLVEEQVYLIDFQGMRLGCSAYDLAALLFDPYRETVLNPDIRKRLWRHYRDHVTALGGSPPPDHLLPTAAVQRLLQALGAYGKLWLTDGLHWYSRFILPGLRLMIAAASENDQYPEMRGMAEQTLELARKKLGI